MKGMGSKLPAMQNNIAFIIGICKSGATINPPLSSTIGIIETKNKIISFGRNGKVDVNQFVIVSAKKPLLMTPMRS